MKRLLIISTVFCCGLIICLFGVLAWGVGRTDAPQGVLIVMGFFPVIAFMFILWVVIAVACSIAMFATRPRSRSAP
jgi:hypothetical protein